jgi:hypothetical protein
MSLESHKNISLNHEIDECMAFKKQSILAAALTAILETQKA